MTAAIVYVVVGLVVAMVVVRRNPSTYDWELGVAAVAWPLVAFMLVVMTCGHIVRLLARR